MQPTRLSVGLLAALLALVACGGAGGGGGGGTAQQQLVPSSTDLAPGEVVRFSLAASPDEAVTWIVEEPEGGSVEAEPGDPRSRNSSPTWETTHACVRRGSREQPRSPRG